MAVKTRKKSLKCPKRKDNVTQPELCVLCGQLSDDSYLGKLVTTPNMAAHENCLLFSPILKQVRDPDDEQDGYIIGFKILDVEKEVKRVSRLKCYVCKGSYAGIGCCNGMCRKSFHLSCGLINNALGVFKGCFQFYCTDHASPQDLTKYLSTLDKIVPECTICLDSLIEEGYDETIQKKSVDNDWVFFLEKIKERCVIHGLCCSRSWMHRTCMRQYGLSAGFHHVKCPYCGDKDTFIEAVQQCGIWLPDRDASWELEPGAFQELYDEVAATADAAEPVVSDFPELGSDYQEPSAEVLKCVPEPSGDVMDRVPEPSGDAIERVPEPSGDAPEFETENTYIEDNIACLAKMEKVTVLVEDFVNCKIIEPTKAAEFVRASPPRLRKRKRQRDSSPKITKRRRTSKNEVKMGILMQNKCARCSKNIVSLNCSSAAVLGEANVNLPAVNPAVMEYVCVSCHK